MLFRSVELLLSRVYLYMQNWEKALEYSDKVIARKPDLVNMRVGMEGFLSKESDETIFSMGGNMLPCVFKYYTKGFKVSDELYESYDENDLRKTSFFWSINEFKGYTKIKPAATGDKDDISYYNSVYTNAYSYQLCEISDKFLFRNAEAYLIKAEAEVCLGKNQESCNTINMLRQKRFALGSDYEVNASGEALMNIIREERRRELALAGHRWFDLPLLNCGYALGSCSHTLLSHGHLLGSRSYALLSHGHDLIISFPCFTKLWPCIKIGRAHV